MGLKGHATVSFLEPAGARSQVVIMHIILVPHWTVTGALPCCLTAEAINIMPSGMVPCWRTMVGWTLSRPAMVRTVWITIPWGTVPCRRTVPYWTVVLVILETLITLPLHATMSCGIATGTVHLGTVVWMRPTLANQVVRLMPMECEGVDYR